MYNSFDWYLYTIVMLLIKFVNSIYDLFLGACVFDNVYGLTLEKNNIAS